MAAPTRALGAEIDRMSDIIEHQLKRAAASGGALLGQAPVEVAQVAAELRGALLKVYADKDLVIELAVAPTAQFVGDRGDLMELLGNLLDNACKWCRSRVRLSAAADAAAGPRERLSLVIEDDGPGISAEDRARVLRRGVRADESVPGHGLGLAMVHDTVDLYGGRLAIDTSALGGARFSLRLPGPLDLELDALRERQLAAPVDRVGLAAHVGLPGIRAGLASAAGVLLAAERAADLRAGGAEVDVGDAAVAAGGRQEGLRVLQPVGEERRGQTVRGGVLLRDRLVE